MQIGRVLAVSMLALSLAYSVIAGDINRNSKKDIAKVESKLITANNNFGLDLFREISRHYPDSNICISPYSIMQALTMTYNGARTTTKEEMEAVLRYKGLSTDWINQGYKSMNDNFKRSDLTTLEMANSIWYRFTYPIADDFVNLNKKYFSADIKPSDFDNFETVGIINDWVSEKTKGKIDCIIESPINPLTTMYLINAVYFLADWNVPFDPTLTYSDDFYIVPDSLKKCDYMFKESEMNYFDGDGFQAVELYYTGDRYKMALFLPDSAFNIDILIGDISIKNINDCLINMSRSKIQLHLPKLKFEFADSLSNDLKGLGMNEAFSGKADFSGMTDSDREIDRLHISEVFHKTFLKIGEQGTEAAAVTVVETKCSAVPETEKPVKVKFNRPYLFTLMDNQTGAIMFIGKVIAPDWK